MILFYLTFLVNVFNSNFHANTTPVVPAKIAKAKEVIKVYPTPNNQGSITIHSARETPLSFYLFDLEGKMIFQAVIKKQQKQTVEGLTKGTYIYNAFENDENIEKGKVELK
jgi:hypothetical protein